MTSYEKQMKWAKARQKENDAKRMQKAQQDDGSNFQPHMYHARVKEFEGTAKEINDRSAQRFIERMRKGNGLGSARSVHSASHESFSQPPVQNDVGRIPSSSYSADGSKRSPLPTTTNSHNFGSASEIVASYSGQYASHGRPTLSASNDCAEENAYAYVEEPSEEASRLDNLDDLSSDSDSGEPIIEMLERERRQWQAERERLIQCIHLQQLEMSQRALAAHERAVDIAKDFTKLIETFETRLETVESNVQKELSSLRSVTESLLSAVNKLSSSNSATPQALPTPTIAAVPVGAIPSASS